MRKLIRLASLVATTLLFVHPSKAATIKFDFEGQNTTSKPAKGGYAKLTMRSGDFVMTLTREDKVKFDLVENVGAQANKPESWGKVSLDPFVDASDSSFIASFSTRVMSFSIEAGYNVARSGVVLQGRAWSGGNMTGDDTGSFFGVPRYSGKDGNKKFPDITVLTVESDKHPFLSVDFIGGTGPTRSPNSMYYDNITIVTAPSQAQIQLKIEQQVLRRQLVATVKLAYCQAASPSQPRCRA